MWAPVDRAWDAVRFAVAAPAAESGSDPSQRSTPFRAAAVSSRLIQIRYVCERDHRPVEHGSLQFDLNTASWRELHRDSRLQKMAECYLESYMKKKA